MPPGGGGSATAAPRWRRRRVAALLFAGALLLIAVALGSRSSPAGPIPVPSTFPAWQTAFEAVVGILAGAVAALCIAVLVSGAAGRPKRRRGPTEPDWVVAPPPTPWWFKVILVLLPSVILGGMIAWIVWTILHRRPLVLGKAPVVPVFSGHPGVAPRAVAAGAAATGVPTLLWIGVVLGALLVAAAALVLIVRTKPRAEAAANGVPDEPPAAVVAAALDALGAETDPRRAVIAAYATMERLLARAGSPRRAADAPTEHLARSLVLLGASQEAARRLTDLFQKARFSHHAIDEPVRQAAFEALSQVRHDLEPKGGRR